MVQFHICHLCLLCRPHDGSVLSALLGKWVHRHPIAASSHTSLDSRINSWGSMIDLHACVGFRGSKKVEKHWSTCLTKLRLIFHWAQAAPTRYKDRRNCNHAITTQLTSCYLTWGSVSSLPAFVLAHASPSSCSIVTHVTHHNLINTRHTFEIAARISLSPLSTTICCRCSAIFGHLARLGDEVPAHKALYSCVRLSKGRLPDPTRKRRPGRPRGRWIDQLGMRQQPPTCQSVEAGY